MSRAEELVRGLATIAILEDDDFKRGIYDHIDGRAATHFLISPFLGLLGYNIYKMNEIRFGYVVDGIEADVALFDNGGTLAAFRVLALNEKGRFAQEEEAFVSDVTKGLALGKIGAPLVVLTNGLDYRLYTIKEDRVELLSAFDLYDLRRADAKTLEFVLSLLDRGSLVGAIDRPLFFNELLVKSKVGSLWTTEYVREALAKVLANPSEYLMDEIAQAIIDVHYDDKSNTQLATDLATEYATRPFNLAELVVGAVTVVNPVPFELTLNGASLPKENEEIREVYASVVEHVESVVEPVDVEETEVETTEVDTVVVEDVAAIGHYAYGYSDAQESESINSEEVEEDVAPVAVQPYGTVTETFEEVVEDVIEDTVEETIEETIDESVEEAVEESVVEAPRFVDPAVRAREEEVLRRDPMAAWMNMTKPAASESDLDLGNDDEEIELEEVEEVDPSKGVSLDSLL